MAFALYLQSQGITFAKFIRESAKSDDNKFFSKQLDRRNFYLFGNKGKINQVLDLRVEDMVMNPLFFKEIADFSQAVAAQNNALFKVKINPLVRSIGFLESLELLRKLQING